MDAKVDEIGGLNWRMLVGMFEKLGWQPCRESLLPPNHILRVNVEVNEKAFRNLHCENCKGDFFAAISHRLENLQTV